ncbi:hypothetical protein F5J12DRAFT_784066 [Pisolithus orientalis]|uniref:uncharacterized protein n=1 Tax=Pisolithus orientalis TaxID=936130 RepID=UPI0022258882|nr:uncharacterized protein F5J12DRAFT_784066 [Pisolithus orientalis]KAI6001526.1 hypothetical protein F5J12DRAFT_784066 [Pisolithus orientalis]
MDQPYPLMVWSKYLMPKAFLGAMAMEVLACISVQPSLFKRELDCLIQYALTAPNHFNNRNLQRTYVYYMHYSEDSSCIKFVVAAVWILDTLHISFRKCVVNSLLITNYGDLLSLEYIVWFASLPVNDLSLFQTFVVTIVQFLPSSTEVVGGRPSWLAIGSSTMRLASPRTLG